MIVPVDEPAPPLFPPFPPGEPLAGATLPPPPPLATTVVAVLNHESPPFVPFPFAAEDHQTVNAQQLVNKNAAMMVKDSEAIDKVVPMIIELAKDENKQNELKKNIGQLGITNADKRVAEEIIKSLTA